ncbi:MAG TPA: ABC transporter ATP-binding protein [Streptosporangiaceae bacterium]|nr:ABC transporter ATP-binding protein [Streptosporangiaceae bacterium]
MSRDLGAGRTALLEVSGVVAGYDAGDVLHGVDLTVAAGEVVCLIGPNGAGKSTLLAAISGLLRPRSGEIVFDGVPITRSSPRRRLTLGIAHVPQERGLFPGLTVWENLVMGAYILRDRAEIRRRAERVADLFPLLYRRRGDHAGALSGGQQKQVELARALMLEPRLILLDEPSTGLEPRARRLVFDAVTRLAADGRAVLLVEQDVRCGLDVADRGALLQAGTVRLTGAGRDLLADERLAVRYLGGPAA